MSLGAFTQHVVCNGVTQTRRPASLVFRSSSARATGPAPRAHVGSRHHFIASPWSSKNVSRKMHYITAQAGDYVDEGTDEGLISFEDIEVGKTYLAKVVKIVSFGIFVNLNSQTDALVHISEIADAYVSNINDYVSKDDIITVKVISKDPTRMRIAASIKQSGVPIRAKFENHNRDYETEYLDEV